MRERRADRPPALVHPGWATAFPWLVQGTTTRGPSERPFDLGLFSGGSGPDVVREHWEALRDATGMDRTVHARQVHGATVRVHGSGAPGLTLVGACDGHVTAEPGVLLTVSTADCVPVFLVDARRRAIGLAHAGWRGAAEGVLEAALARLVRDLGAAVVDVHVHLGPAICGRCYEVGPEVFVALGLPGPSGPTPVDLPGALVERARAAGVPGAQITRSTHCTRCTGSGLFSHRGGDAHRQVGYLAIRPAAQPGP